MPRRHQKSTIRRYLLVLFLSGFMLCLWLAHVPLTLSLGGLGNLAAAQSPDASFLVQQGVDFYQRGDMTGAIAQWQAALSAYQENHNRQEEVMVLANLARAEQQIGNISQAINYWGQAITVCRQLGNHQLLGRMLTEQAQAYSKLGQQRQAIAILCGEDTEVQGCDRGSVQIARGEQDPMGEAAALGSLGEAYLLTGQDEQAIRYVQDSLKIASQINNLAYQSSALNTLGNIYINLAEINYRRANFAEQRGESEEAKKLKRKAIDDDQEALKQFQASLNLAQTQNKPQSQLRALLNSIPAYDRTQASTEATEARQQALELLKSLPNSQDKVYATIDLAHLLQLVTPSKEISSAVQCLQPELRSPAQSLLEQAISTAQSIQDRRSESFALGELGHIYECHSDFSRALEFTQQARIAAEQSRLAKDSLYLWEWQSGRILKAQHKEVEATKLYERAAVTLESIRSELLNTNRDLQFDFRDTVNPLYRELIQLKLEQASLPSITPDKRTKQLNSTLTTIDSLQLAELQNYFGNDCIVTALKPDRVDAASAGTATAIISSIILKNRTAILVSLPNGEKKSVWVNTDSKALIQEINEFRRGLERYADITYDPTQAQKLYNWIIRPFTADLDSAQVKTLVFVQDGILRSVPMAALHDGEKFLVQKYAIATTPSLTLTAPEKLNRQGLRALAVGLTKEAIINGQTFPPLVNVRAEIQDVETLIPGSKQLLDGNFTSDRLKQELSKTVYPIIHIATHGEFGTEPEDTFLVTGNNGKLTISDLDTAIHSIRPTSARSVDLLVLTACETAVGDDRATLGLGGIAVQAGVSSTLASLWFIQDAQTVTLVDKFYSSLLNSSVSKAEALRLAQLELIKSKYAHPAYWSPFILIGNWL